ncbi:hypothetical protein KKG31_03655 [Patescibacteria group bacterium]|nr:hypothetical protein [Patescibacteria group bacterium]MBU1758241.1 hypothetical protein [Patescibacteria group bacterium]
MENLTVDAYKEILTKAKKDAEFKKSLSDMLKNIDKGTGKIVITKKNEKADRLDVSDTITFDFSSNSIEQTISLWPAFENINTILDNHVVAKKPQEFIYTYQTGTWKIETGVKSDTETNNETKDSHEGISID